MVVQSPLNYTGSKMKMVPIIKEYLPQVSLRIFIDASGGGFNVGINNPALTAQVWVYVARASMRQHPGCYTMVEPPVIDMLPGECEDLIWHLV